MRCGVYVRVSTEDQRDNGYSIDSQLRMIKEYCEKNNYCKFCKLHLYYFCIKQNYGNGFSTAK